MKIFDVEIIDNIKLCDDIFLLSFECEYITSNFRPGNFVQILIQKDSIYPLLRRPFSIAYIDGKIVYIGYQVVGLGTSLLSMKRKGDNINILGPLGNSFPIKDCENIALIGGGCGVYPLYGLLKTLKSQQKKVDTFLGFRDKNHLFWFEEYNRLSYNMFISTNDGSFGYKGNIVELFKMNKNNYDVIYACGPKPMLHALKQLNIEKEVYASFEEKMACGIGACLCCSIKLNDNNIAHVCSDGPVFNLMEVEF